MLAVSIPLPDPGFVKGLPIPPPKNPTPPSPRPPLEGVRDREQRSVLETFIASPDIGPAARAYPHSRPLPRPNGCGAGGESPRRQRRCLIPLLEDEWGG